MLRRDFFKTCGLGIAGVTALAPSLAKTTSTAFKSGVVPRNSAENLILISLNGAPSHVDTFDLKTGSWTPSDFEAANFGNINLAGALFPNLSQQTDKFSLLRAITGTEAVHDRARYICQTCHTYNPVFAQEQPNIGSLIAWELAASRRDSDVLPSFLNMNADVQGAGMLESAYAPFTFNSGDGVTGLNHPEGQDMFRKRYQSLLATDGASRFGASTKGGPISDFHNFYALGEKMMYNDDVTDVFTLTDADLARYGESAAGAGCALAVRAIAKDAGTRVVQVNQGGWDSHYDIYDRNVGGNIYDLTAELDQALAATLEDLAEAPGKRGGTLLDETLVIAMGEFGRTPGPVTNNLGRDHYPYAFSALFAGGGVTQGQVFGGTDAEGYTIIDPFWSENRYITMQDIIATIYSSMGVDWTKELTDTPSGRVYEYTPKVDGVSGYYKDIAAMFS